ncbi:hypothetical protein PROFUN_01442 [Planoprotostelium fungivorum]|uniref:Uncharacterized protein n=1 Tax=Planoprotostelium fungivorum TaxID=1890364 RepID=A0A2P6NTC5_9EUKA|nr:hypothetical protein PROFUN_01442 [Planoprotostelium fungivorum]
MPVLRYQDMVSVVRCWLGTTSDGLNFQCLDAFCSLLCLIFIPRLTQSSPVQTANITNTMKTILLALGLAAVCLASADGSFAAAGPDGAVKYSSNEAARLLSIASILNGGTNDVDDRGLLSDINIIGNFIGGKKNRIDAINDFGGDFSGFAKRSDFLGDTFGCFRYYNGENFSLVDLIYDLLTPHRQSQATSAFFGMKRYAALTDDFSLLRDLNVIGNFIGGKENRIDTINRYKGIGSGAF